MGQAFDLRQKERDAKMQLKKLNKLQKKQADQTYKLKKKQLVEAQKLVSTMTPPRKGKKKYYDPHADLYSLGAELFGDQIRGAFSGADGAGHYGGDGGGGGAVHVDGGGGGGGGAV